MPHVATTLGSRVPRACVVVLVAASVACRREEKAPPPVETRGAEVPLPAVSPPFSTPPVLPGTPDVPALVARVTPAVVNITSTTEVTRRGPAHLFDFFFGDRGRGGADEVLERRSLGSGFLVDAAGHVVTNAHVVAGATSVRVRLSDGRELPARIKGSDPRLDVAVLEVDGPRDLPFAALGSSEALRVGEYVVAIGNPFGLGDTVTMGIVSAKGRELGAGPYDDFIQTDASINPGNSGGPLFNLKGEVVGINAVVASGGHGIGFAIPIDDVKDVVPQLLATGRVHRGRLGVMIQPVDQALARAFDLPKPEGALVNEVEPGGPAEKAGLQPGDVILAVDEARIESAHDLPRVVARRRPNTRVTLEVATKGKGTRKVAVVLDELPDDAPRPPTPPEPPRPLPRRELGVSLGDDPRAGVVVREVDGGGAAAGVLEPGDVVVEVDGAPVKSAAAAVSAMRGASADKPVVLRVRRHGRTRFVAIAGS